MACPGEVGSQGSLESDLGGPGSPVLAHPVPEDSAPTLSTVASQAQSELGVDGTVRPGRGPAAARRAQGSAHGSRPVSVHQRPLHSPGARRVVCGHPPSRCPLREEQPAPPRASPRRPSTLPEVARVSLTKVLAWLAWAGKSWADQREGGRFPGDAL